MIVSYYGAECFKISQGSITLALNPISKKSKFKSVNFGADITIITTDLPDFNGVEQTSRGEKSSFLIDGPGEYEVKGVFVRGFLSEGPEGKVNTIYLISFEDVNICFLGALTDLKLPEEMLEATENVDLLFAPLGLGKTLDPQSAYKLAVSLEAGVIVPMYYDKPSLEKFIKEGGQSKVSPIDKFVAKKSDFLGKKGEVIILKEE